MRNLLSVLMFCWLCFFCLSQALADFRITPGLSLRQEYNDNIFLDAKGEEGDFITTLTPSVFLEWQTPRIDMSLDAKLELQKYFDNTDEDRIGAGTSEQGSTFNALFKIYRENLFLRVADIYQRIPIDEGDRGGEGNSLVNLTDSNRFIVNPYMQFELIRDLQVRLGYTYENLWYEEGEGDDADSHAYTLAFTKIMTPRTTLNLEGTHLEYRPKDPLKDYIIGEEGDYEYDRDSARIGVSYLVGDRLQLQGGYGHTWIDYEVRDDVDSSIWDISMDYQFSSAFQAGIAYLKDYTVSVEDGPSKRDKSSLFLAYQERFSMKASVFVSNDEFVEINREDESYGGDLGGVFPFTDKYGLDWQLRYTSWERTGIDAEEYDRYGARLAFYYDVKWGRLSLGYTYNRNDSDIEENDYTNNIIYLQANLIF